MFGLLLLLASLSACAGPSTRDSAGETGLPPCRPPGYLVFDLSSDKFECVDAAWPGAQCPGVMQWNGTEIECVARPVGSDAPALCTLPCDDIVLDPPGEPGVVWGEIPWCAPQELDADDDGCVLTYSGKRKCFECVRRGHD